MHLLYTYAALVYNPMWRLWGYIYSPVGVGLTRRFFFDFYKYCRRTPHIEHISSIR